MDDAILALVDASSTPLTTSAVGNLFDAQAMQEMFALPTVVMDVPEEVATEASNTRAAAIVIVQAMPKDYEAKIDYVKPLGDMNLNQII